MDPIIKVRDLEVVYNKRNGPIFTGLNIDFYPGQVVLIMGPNGGGKSTLIKSMVGIVKPSKGYIDIMGQNPITDLSIRKRIGYVPQISDFNIYAPITLWDLVSLGRFPLLGLFNGFTKVDEEAVYQAVKKVGLEDFIDYKLSELSGGQLSRGFIARALAQDPDVYLLDEPFESIDYVSEEIILKVLRDEAGKGKAVIVTEHHLSEVEYIDRIVLFRRGVVADGSPEEVLKDEFLQKAYLG